jgi:hypothetical protein
MTIVDEIRERFLDNLDRVKSMVAIYESQAGQGTGRRAVGLTDLLRSAVVLLHATLEDLLRSLCEWKMPGANPDAFSEIPLVGTRGKLRFGVSELAGFRGKTVDEVITQCVNEYLEKSSFNHPGDIKAALERIGIKATLSDRDVRTLAAMMTRRHWIAHRADRNTSRGPGQHPVTSLSNAMIAHWMRTVERFGNELLSRV